MKLNIKTPPLAYTVLFLINIAILILCAFQSWQLNRIETNLGYMTSNITQISAISSSKEEVVVASEEAKPSPTIKAVKKVLVTPEPETKE
jgi:hypothetical protein